MRKAKRTRKRETKRETRGREIPAAELEVLSALWRIERGTVRDVLEELQGQDRHLAYTTVLTLLGRLKGRGYVQCNRDSQPFVYRPRITRESVSADRLESLVEQVYDGKPMPLILHLVQAHKLSGSDLGELRDLLAGLSEESRARKRRK